MPGPRTRLTPRDLALGLLVVGIWGYNFVPIRVALDAVPPFLLASLRFLLAAVPAVFFVKRPAVPWRTVVGYGFLIGVGQFGLLFLAIRLGMPAGLASLVMQPQVFFTIFLGRVWLGDRIRSQHLLGAALAAVGIGVIAAERDAAGATPLVLALTLAAAACWSVGNIVAKKAAREHADLDAFALVVWSSLVAPLPLAGLSFAFEGGLEPWRALPTMGLVPWAALVFMSVAGTLFGFAAWNGLLHRYPSALVTPLAFLVPVAGIASTAVFLGERFTAMQAAGGIVVMGGLAVTLFGASFAGAEPRASAPPRPPLPPRST